MVSLPVLPTKSALLPVLVTAAGDHADMRSLVLRRQHPQRADPPRL